MSLESIITRVLTSKIAWLRAQFPEIRGRAKDIFIVPVARSEGLVVTYTQVVDALGKEPSQGLKALAEAEALQARLLEALKPSPVLLLEDKSAEVKARKAQLDATIKSGTKGFLDSCRVRLVLTDHQDFVQDHMLAQSRARVAEQTYAKATAALARTKLQSQSLSTPSPAPKTEVPINRHELVVFADGKTLTVPWHRRRVLLPHYLGKGARIAIDNITVPKGRLKSGPDGLFALEDVFFLLCPQYEEIYNPTRGYNPSSLEYLREFAGMKLISLPIGQDIQPDDNGLKVKVKVHIPDELVRVYADSVLGLFNHCNVVGGYVTDDKVVGVINESGKPMTWMEHHKPKSIFGAAKITKRAKPQFSGHSVVATYKTLCVKVLDPETEAARLGLSVEDFEKCSDGACFISRAMVNHLIRGLIRRSPYKSACASQCLTCIQCRGYRRLLGKIKRFRMAKSLTLRVNLRGQGMLKAFAYVVDSLGSQGIQTVDIETHPCNIKKEVTETPDFEIMATPNVGKGKVRTNTQGIINMPELFREDLMEKWTRLHLNALRFKILNQLQIESRDDVEAAAQHHLDKNETIEQLVYLMLRSQALQFNDLGLGVHHSKHLLEMMVKEQTESLIGKGDKISIHVPGARFLPILPYSFVSRHYPVYKPQAGECKFSERAKCLVVSDQDWVANLGNHGGCDMDDKFYCFWRKDSATGKPVCVVYRSPNYVGEWAAYTVPFEQDIPEETMIDRDLKERPMPLFAIDLGKMPKRASDVTKDGDIQVGQLPESGTEKSEYTKDFFLTQVRRALGGSGPGFYMDLLSLATQIGYPVTELPCTLEQIVDVTQQGTDTGSLTYLDLWFTKFKDRLFKSGRQVDQTFFQARFKGVKEEDCTLVPVEGPITRTRKMVETLVQETRTWIRRSVEIKTPAALTMPTGKNLQAQALFRLWNMGSWCQQGYGIFYEIRMEYVDKPRHLEPQMYRELSEALKDLLDGDLELLRGFAYLLHQKPLSAQAAKVPPGAGKIETGNYLKRSDSVLLTKAIWPLYKQILATGPASNRAVLQDEIDF